MKKCQQDEVKSQDDETDCAMPQISKQTYSNLCLNDLLGNPDHFAKVQFAFKLGYTENELMTVLRLVGPDARRDKILGELVRLTAKKNSSLNDGSLTDDEIVEDEIMEGIILDEEDDNLRHIIIDGSNIAMRHGNKEVFNCMGIRLAVEYFIQRGHRDITVFVPQWRKEVQRPESPIKNQEILFELEKKKYLVFTPARRIGGKRVVCYDDRYILKLAAETGGVVVSNDNYRDLISENPEYKRVIEERLLMYSFVNDRFMPPDDPLGRHGPTLDSFLRKESPYSDQLPMICPYQKKCTYGNKCKYYHPERGLRPQKSVSEKLAEEAKHKLQVVKDRKPGDMKVKHDDKRQQLEPAMTYETVNISTDPERRRAQDERLDKYRLKIEQIEQREKRENLENSIQHKVQYDCVNIPPSLSHDDGSHLSLARHLSQEDSMKSQKDVISHGRDSLPIATIGSQVEELHRKLDRQLSLNNREDYRINQQSIYKPYMSMSTTALDCASRGKSPVMSDQLPPQQMIQARALSERIPEHIQVARMGSDPYPRVKQQLEIPPKRFNSTSDPVLNGLSQYQSTPWLDASAPWINNRQSLQYQYHAPPYQRLDPVRPDLPQQSTDSIDSLAPFQQSFPPRVQYVPVPGYVFPADAPIPYDDPRYQLYYHLCCIFPEERVRTVMNRYPNELNPQKICAYILDK